MQNPLLRSDLILFDPKGLLGSDLLYRFQQKGLRTLAVQDGDSLVRALENSNRPLIVWTDTNQEQNKSLLQDIKLPKVRVGALAFIDGKEESALKDFFPLISTLKVPFREPELMRTLMILAESLNDLLQQPVKPELQPVENVPKGSPLTHYELTKQYLKGDLLPLLHRESTIKGHLPEGIAIPEQLERLDKWRKKHLLRTAFITPT